MSPVTPQKPKTAAQVAAEALLRANEAVALNEETHRLVKEVHAALMAPLPGYHKSFVERATEVVVEAEAGKIMGEKFVWLAKVLTALGVIGTSLYAAVHWGAPK